MFRNASALKSSVRRFSNDSEQRLLRKRIAAQSVRKSMFHAEKRQKRAFFIGI